MSDQGMHGRPVIFACSPRKGGNSDSAAECMAGGLKAAGHAPRILHLRDYTILPCIGCYRCEKDPDGRCFQESMDQSQLLFQSLFDASAVLFSSPIFFYHIPAHAKAFIDRGQSFWVRRQREDERLLGLPHRKALVSLVAGRPRGEKLFAGTLLTLKIFLELFNITIEDSVVFRGKDGPSELREDQEAVQALTSATKLFDGNKGDAPL